MSRSPLRTASIRRFVFAYGINQLGDWAGDLALAIAVFGFTHSAAAVAAVWLVHRAGLGLLTPVLAARLEHLAPTRALPALYLIQCALFTVLALTPALGSVVLILPLVAVNGLLAPTGRAISRSALLGVSRPVGLHHQTNALVNVVFTANGVLAPALGGALVAAAGPRAALLADGATFVLAAIAVAGIRCERTTSETPAEPVRTRLLAALAHVQSNPALRALLLGDASIALFLFAISPIEVVFVSDTLHAGSTGLGLVLGAWGAGMIGGAMTAARARRASLPTQLVAAGSLLAVALLGMGLAPSLLVVATWSAVGGVGNGVGGTAFVTLLQERTADEFQVRIGSLYELSGSVAPALGFVLGGVTASIWSPRATYLVAGAGAAMALAWAVRSFSRGGSAPRPLSADRRRRSWTKPSEAMS